MLTFFQVNHLFTRINIGFCFLESNERSEKGLADLFLGKSLKILMHLGIMHLLSSIETHLLKVT